MRSRVTRFVFILGLWVLLLPQGDAHGQALIQDAPPPARIQARAVAPYVVHTWTDLDGLPDEQINAIVQTRDGYLWLGTYAGLVRFDGLTFETFTAGSTQGVLSDRIQVLHEDRRGTLWIGTEGRGVFMLRDGVFSTPEWNAELSDRTILALAEGSDGGLWIGTSTSAIHVDVARAQIVSTHATPGHANAILETQDGTVWLGVSDHGLFRIDGDRVHPAEADLGSPLYTAGFHEDSVGVLWAATSSGLYRVQDGEAVRISLPGPASQARISELAADPAGGFWVGTRRGLCRVDRGVPVCYGADHGLSNAVQTLGTDREGNLWVGTSPRDLNRVSRRTATSYAPSATEPPTFGPLIGDGAGGIWAGSICNGLWHLRDGMFEQYQIAEGVPSYCIGALHRDDDGTLWLAGSAEGLIRIRSGRVTVFGDAGKRMNAIARDVEGVLWVGSNEPEALKRMMPDERFEGYRLPVEGAAVQFIAPRREGGLWVGTTAGLFSFIDATFSRPGGADDLAPTTVRSVIEDPDGTLWIATYGQGLNRLQGGRRTRYTADNGLPAQEISWLIDDGRGRLWMSSNDGVLRVDRDDLTAIADGRRLIAETAVSFDETDGLASGEVTGGNQPAGWLAPDGRLWFPMRSGLVAIGLDPPINAHVPPVAITRAIVDRKASVPQGELVLPPAAHNLEVRYTALSFTAPQKVQFRYRLEGYDSEWIDAGNRRVAYYTALPPGRYQFRVRARTEGSMWSETNTALAIYQVPFFFQTRWFAAFSVAALLGAGVAAYRLRLRAIMRQTKALEATVAARTTEVVEQRNQLAQAHAGLVAAHDELTTGHRRVQEAHEAAISLLDQMPLGVCVIDGKEQVTFLSSVAQRVLGYTSDEAAAHDWRTVLPLSPDDCSRVEAMLAAPMDQRRRTPVRLDSDERRYWMEIEVRNDPTDASRRILYLHDVTELFDLQRLLGGDAQFQGLIGETTVMRLVYRQIRDLAAADSTVVIEGETGTGKELVARAIHALSGRSAHPFVAVNCAGLTESILTSQLFGHRRGAFTGAIADQIGLFEAANRGMLLLDEIGDVSPAVQANLLRVLQEREITRIGESRARPIDVRVLAATHRNLQAEVAAGRFRQDLFYRLRVVHVQLPALRERKDDIPVLVTWFLGQLRAAGHAQVYEVSRAAMDLLLEHDWPGNVRELKSVVESAALASEGRVIEVASLPGELVSRTSSLPVTSDPTLDARDRDHVRLALERTHGNRAAAARLLGVSRNTLYRRLRELNLDSVTDPSDTLP